MHNDDLLPTWRDPALPGDPPFRTSSGLLGAEIKPLQGAALRSSIWKDGLRENLGQSGARSGLGMRMVCASAHDLGRGLLRAGRNSSTDIGHKLEGIRRHADEDGRPP